MKVIERAISQDLRNKLGEITTCPSDRKLSNLVCLHTHVLGACQSLHVSVIDNNLLDWPG